MSWRSIIISNPAKLSSGNGRLNIEQECERFSVPLEDIGAIVLESPQISLTVPLLREIAKGHISMFICDEKHLPCGVIQPFHQHSRQARVLQSQLALSRPFAKNCWKKIIERKIINQAACLRLLSLEGVLDLEALALEIRSGDTTNREGVAARIYFAKLAPKVIRNDETAFNAALDYGYAIFRGALARSLSSFGFLPALGLWHHSELNPFNLADDFLETFRPLVDLWVGGNIQENSVFSQDHRKALVALLHKEVRIEGEEQKALRAIEICVASFSSACRERDPTLLRLPELL
ncbi:MAG: type II CRISPR-associated endonuclease Cas1 [Synergistales bacterium]